jgi:WXG100 family type VII secretion target
VDYDALRAASKAVGGRSETIKQISDTLANRASILLASWDGVAEQSWYAQLVSCQSRMAKTPRLLDELARDLSETARIIEEAEHAARAMIAATVTADG